MVITDESHPDRIGTAVLVHGGWGHPDDWTWVRRELEAADVQVITPDLPSHRSRVASFAADVEAVRDAIRVSQPPVVVAGCSYGGDVTGVAAVGEDSVIRLTYVASVPVLASSERTDTAWVDAVPHLLVDENGAFVLDNGWWFEAEAERLFDGEVLEHLRRTPRRWVSRASAADPRTAEGSLSRHEK